MELDDIVREFLLESSENLDQLDLDLVALESEPESRPLLASVFRTIHTIKGTCGFLPFPRLERVAHRGENLLAQLRDGRLALTPEVVEVGRSAADRSTRVDVDLLDSLKRLVGELVLTRNQAQFLVAKPFTAQSLGAVVGRYLRG